MQSGRRENDDKRWMVATSEAPLCCLDVEVLPPLGEFGNGKYSWRDSGSNRSRRQRAAGGRSQSGIGRPGARLGREWSERDMFRVAPLTE